MNCREVTEILDNRKGALDPAQKREAEAHTATCTECAEAWHLQMGLAALPGMKLPVDFAGRCRALVARGAQSVPDRRKTRRVVVGTLAVLAAAAAILALLPRPTASIDPDAPAVKAPVAGTDGTKPVIGLEAVALSPGAPQENSVEPPVKPNFTVSVVAFRPLPETPPADRVWSALPAADYAAMRAYQNSPPRQQAVLAFHNALLDELSRVPGLTVVDPDQPVVDSSAKNYRVYLATTTQFGLDGRVVPGNDRFYSLGVNAEQLKPQGQSVRRMSSGVTIDLLAPCAGMQPVADAPPCKDPRGQAAEMVRKLRREVFPPDASVIKPLQVRLQNSSLDASQRIRTLEDVFKLSRDHDDLSFLRGPGVVGAALALAASGDPAQRTQIWRMMRGVGSPELIQPMLNSLTQDPAEVRLAAIETLTADFLGDPRVRSALASLTVEDPNPLVRAVADRGVSGEAPWRRYVVSSLQDPGRPAAQRVEALVYFLYPLGPTSDRSPSQPDYWQILEQLDDRSVRALAEALPNAGKLQGGNTYNLYGNFAARHNKNPAVIEMMLGTLERDPNPVLRTIAGQTLARTQFSDPRVRDAVTKAVQSDPDTSVRDQIRQTIPVVRP